VRSQQVNELLLNEMQAKQPSPWNSFSKKEFMSAINECSNFSALGPDRICIDLGHWPTHFKMSSSIIIP